MNEFLGVGRDPKFLGRVVIKNSFTVPSGTFTQGQELVTISLLDSEISFPAVLEQMQVKVNPIALGANVSLPRVEVSALGKTYFVVGIPASADGADNTQWYYDENQTIGEQVTGNETKAIIVKFFASSISGAFNFSINIYARFREF